MARQFKVKMAKIYNIFLSILPKWQKLMGKIPKMAKTGDKNGKSGPTKCDSGPTKM